MQLLKSFQTGSHSSRLLLISNRLPLLVLISTCSRFRASFLYLSQRSSQEFLILLLSIWSPSINSSVLIHDREGHYWVCQIFIRFLHILALSPHCTRKNVNQSFVIWFNFCSSIFFVVNIKTIFFLNNLMNVKSIQHPPSQAVECWVVPCIYYFISFIYHFLSTPCVSAVIKDTPGGFW